MVTLVLMTAALTLGVGNGGSAWAGDLQLLANPGFDTSLTGWDLPVSDQVQWNPEDAQGDPESGSVEAVNVDSESGSETVVLQQCVSLAGAGIYRISTSARLLSGQATSGSVVARITLSTSPDCPGSGFSISGRFITTEPDQWQQEQWEVNSGGATGSALVEVAVRKDQAGGELAARIDDVGLEFIDQVFADRFESMP